MPDGIDPEAWNSQESEEYKKALDALTRVWDIFPNRTGQITYQFDRGQRFKLCVTGNQWDGIDSINAFVAKISVEENQAESSEGELPKSGKNTSEVSLNPVNQEKWATVLSEAQFLNSEPPGTGPVRKGTQKLFK